jgi:hypothetical protein
MRQINGADARLIVRPETTFKTLPVVPVHPCELAFDELVDGDVVVSLDTAIFKQGAKSNKLAVADGCGAGDILATDAIAAKDLSGCTKIGMWIRSSVALALGDLQLLLDDTVSCGSPIESIDIPAITEVDTWKYVKLTLVTPASCAAIISVGIKMIVDVGALNLWIDDIRGLEGDAIIIPFDTARFGMQEDLEKSNAITGNRQPQMPTGGTISGAGGITVELNPYHAVLIKHMLGGCATTDLTGDKYQHVLTIDDLGEGLAIEVQHTKANKCTVFHCKGNTLKISQNATGKIMADFGYEQASEEAETLVSTLDGDPTSYGHKPFNAKSGAFSEGGVPAAGYATTFAIDFNNFVEGEPTIGSEGEKDDLSEGQADINFNFDILFKDSTILDKAKLGTESSVKIENQHGTGVGTSGNEYLSIETPEVLYARPQQAVDGPRGLKLTFSGIAYYDDDAGGEAIEITIKNAQASIP